MANQVVDILVFRLKNVFKNSNDNHYTRKELFDTFIHDKNHNIIKAINILVEKNYLTSFRLHGREYIYSYIKTPTRSFHKFDSLIEKIDPAMTFGIEFEFGSKIEQFELENMLEEADFDVTRRIFGTRKYTKWEVSYDMSIDVEGYTHEVEIISPILKGEQGLREIKKMTDFLNTLKKMKLIKQNHSCGTHVHHSAKKYTSITKLINLMEKSQHIQNKFVVNHRVWNDKEIKSCLDEIYCAPVVKYKYFDGKKIKVEHEKHVNLNVIKFRKHGTVEFRQLQGTTEFRKIAAWTIMAQRIIRNSRKNKKETYINSVDEFYDFLGIEEEVQRGLQKCA